MSDGFKRALRCIRQGCTKERYSQSGSLNLCSLHYGHYGNRRGRLGEELVAAVIRSMNLPWIVNVRLATDEEDALGIDVICETDAGPLWIQVKSGRACARRPLLDHVVDGVRASPGAEPEGVARHLLPLLRSQLALRKSAASHGHEVASS